jgi:glycosyltransferase involved in cell wall biosynthesis
MLASVIIPCYNAERWIDEAIQSALDQTHPSVEVIVVDDGSSDASWKKIQKFGNRIIAETGPNRGGSAARNRGFVLARGDYIQFLDADDYLLPEKIARQVAFLEASGADVVYGDWRHQRHEPDGSVRLENVAVSGERGDVLTALLANWWVAPCALLFRREIVQRCGGWDESLAVAQDTDFFISIAMAGAKIAYQPGCHSIYRRYGPVTISTSNRRRWLDNHHIVLDKALGRLEKKGRLTSKYCRAAAHSYFALARNYFDFNPDKYEFLMHKVLELDPKFRPRESLAYNTTRRLLGYSAAERLASFKRRHFPSNRLASRS